MSKPVEVPPCTCLVCRAARAAEEWPVGVERDGWQVAWTAEYGADPRWREPGKVMPPAGERLTGDGPGVIPHGTLTHSPLSEAELWRLRFTALVARVAGVCTEDGRALSCEGGDRSGVVRLGWAELEAARELTLITWPMVEASVDYTVYRAPEART